MQDQPLKQNFQVEEDYEEIEQILQDALFKMHEVYRRNKLSKPQPLFTTEDGVDVFGRDCTVWILETKEQVMWKTNAASWTGQVPNRKVFAALHKLEEYRLFSAPVLSLEEICDSVPAYGADPVWLNAMKQMVKKKLTGK